MRRIFLLSSAVALACTAVTAQAADAPAAASVSVNPGKMLYSPDGKRIGAVYRVNAAGDPQIIMSGKLVTIPASTLSEVNGKLTTSLDRKDIGNAK